MTPGLDTGAPQLRATRCAICDLEGNALERWPATFTPGAFSARVFSARRVPDRVHYRMVACRSCGVVRSDPVASEELLAELYTSSSFDYGKEVQALQATYGRALSWLETRTPRREALLEIGCGNGFFLQQAHRQGWQTVRGVEPSTDAVANAPAELDGAIVQDVMRRGLFAPCSFDAVCLFQVLDHMPEPVDLLEQCFEILRPGGHVLAFNHNVGGLSARVLGERSPIVDIEHTYLYSPATMRAVVEKAGFGDPQVRSVLNTCSVAYVAHLLPLPARVKSRLVRTLRAGPLVSIRVTLPLGNLCLIARRPD